MKLNTLAPEEGSRHYKKRLGRGIGSGLGKTSGRGHKGQKARSGGYHKINFEGGQMPIQRRLPKMGFKSKKLCFKDQVTLSELSSLQIDTIDMNILKANGLIHHFVKAVKVICSGELDKAVNLKGIKVTRGARAIIENLGGNVEA